MVVTPASTRLVALFFANSSLDPQSWQDIFQSAVSELRINADGNGQADSPSQPQTKFLDGKPSAPRVAELRIQVGRTLSLPECKPVGVKVKDAIAALKLKEPVEVILQPEDLYAAHRAPGLAVFDMDSTLIQQEVIDELARAVGLYSQVAAITEAAMRGEEPYTDFSASLRARVALLKGVPGTIWDRLKSEVIVFTPGARELVRVLRSLGWKTAVLSGGFIPLAEWVKETLGLDYAYANHLVSDPATHALTGELVSEAPIVDGLKKRELLLELAKQNSIPIENVIAVGDGSNDLPMMGVSGLGIAFNAKPKVQLAAPSSLNSPSLIDVLHILGYTRDEIDESIASAS